MDGADNAQPSSLALCSFAYYVQSRIFDRMVCELSSKNNLSLFDYYIRVTPPLHYKRQSHVLNVLLAQPLFARWRSLMFLKKELDQELYLDSLIGVYFRFVILVKYRCSSFLNLYIYFVAKFGLIRLVKLSFISSWLCY